MADATPTSIDSPRYTILFALVVCLVCATLVSAPAVLLKPAQEANARLYKEKNVLVAAGLAEQGQSLSVAEVDAIFDRAIEARLIDRATGELLPPEAGDARRFDVLAARDDPATSVAAPQNRAGLRRLSDKVVVYFVREDGETKEVVITVDGAGMWGPIRGFVALAPDGTTVRGFAIYDQRETPGLGAEIASARWLALWRGRETYDESGAPALRVAKGPAGDPHEDRHRVDGLSGATITSNAVTALYQFWLGEQGYAPFLKRFREGEFR